MRIFLVFTLIMLTVFLGGDGSSKKEKDRLLATSYSSPTVSDKSPTTQDESGKPCLTHDEIESALQRFTSRNDLEVKEANATKAMLLDKSKESSVCRNKIITALMKAMDKPHLNFSDNMASYVLWRYGAVLLGELKASEAIDLLIKHLTLKHVVFSGSMNHQPALLGVVEMGSIAIPKLTEVLRHNPDGEMRFYAVWSIATIGGDEAVSSLRESLESETDECIKSAISISLNSFDDKGQIKNWVQWRAIIHSLCTE